MTTWTWMERTTTFVYGETQVRDDILMGDILLVHGENVVGFLLDAWPVAVTKNKGEFHSFDKSKLPIRYVPSWDRAVELANLFEFPLEG